METYLRIEGGIFGHLIGNALGTRCATKTLNRSVISQQIARSYEYEGAMTLCTMASIIDSDGIDPEDIANRFHEWYIGSYLASKGQSQGRISVYVSQAMRHYSNGMPPDRCGSKDESDNAALVRMLPLALWNANQSISTIVRDAHAITKFTNQQIDAQVCSALYCLVIRSFLTGSRERASNCLAEYYETANLHGHLEILKEIQEDRDPPIHGTDTLKDSFWSTMKIFAGYGKEFEEGIIQSVLLGHDCGGTACLVGSLCGISNGINDIPQRWLNQLDLSEEAEKVVKEFVRVTTKRN